MALLATSKLTWKLYQETSWHHVLRKLEPSLQDFRNRVGVASFLYDFLASPKHFKSINEFSTLHPQEGKGGVIRRLDWNDNVGTVRVNCFSTATLVES